MKCENLFVIVDTKNGNFYRGYTEYVPWILNAFTNEFFYAKVYRDKERAKRDLETMYKEQTDFDGNSPLEAGRLVVMQVCFKEV